MLRTTFAGPYLYRLHGLATSTCRVMSNSRNRFLTPSRGVHLAASPTVARMDEPVTIQVSDLDPGQPVTMATKLEEGGDTYVAHAFYAADDGGRVDLTHSTSTGGSYIGCEPMGLFWGLLPQEGSKPGLRLRKKDVMQPHHMTLSVLSGHVTATTSSCHEPSSVLCQTTLERHYAWEDVIRVPVREGRLRGTLFIPKNGTGRHRAVLDVYGSTGGLAEYRAAMLASRGFTSFALAWALYDDLPPGIHVQYDYFLEAIDFLNNHPNVIPDNLGIISISLSGPIAMAIATLDTRIRAVVCISSWGSRAMCPHSHNGEELPFKECDVSLLETVKEGLYSWKKVQYDCADGKAEGHEKVRVQAEKARHTDFLFLHGADDQNTDARLILHAAYRMLDHGHNGVSIHMYQGAGHLLEPPYIPFCYDSWHKLLGGCCVWGGEAKRHSHAQVDAWHKILDFFNDRLTHVHSQL